MFKERFSTTDPTDDKEKELWVELKRLFELDSDDTLWKLQRYMHDPLIWRLYDTCGVHHVSSVRGHDIFMLVEKDYPLSKGVLMLMLVNKLLVEADSEMSRELLRKIFYQANRPIMCEIHKLFNESYAFYDRVMYPFTTQQERKTQKDYGTKRGRHSTSSSSAFGQPSSSHLNDDVDGNDEGTSRASTLSPTRFINSLTNEVPRVFLNPPNIDPNMEPFYTRQTKILNRQVQLRDEHRGGLKSIRKGIKILLRGKKKK
ncbi:hypothetical protein Tco_0965216 [Tanacetum coccineum]